MPVLKPDLMQVLESRASLKTGGHWGQVSQDESRSTKKKVCAVGDAILLLERILNRLLCALGLMIQIVT